MCVWGGGGGGPDGRGGGSKVGHEQCVSIELKVSQVERMRVWGGGGQRKHEQRVSIEFKVSVAEVVCVCVWGGGGGGGGQDGGWGVEEGVGWRGVWHVYKQSKSTSSASTHRADALASNHCLSIISWGSEVVQGCFGS